MPSMTHALHCIKNQAWPGTHKEQHYFPSFSAVCQKKTYVVLRKWLHLLCLEKIRFYNTLCEVLSRQASKQTNVWGYQFCLSSRKEEEGEKKLHFNEPSSAVSGMGGCAHWITTLLLLHSIKTDSSLQRGSWFDRFLLKQIWRKRGCGRAGILVQAHLFIFLWITWTLMMSWLSASLILKGHFPYLEVVSITCWVQFPICHKTAWVILTIYLRKDYLTVLYSSSGN